MIPANPCSSPDASTAGKHLAAPAIWLNDSGWDLVLPGEYGLQTEFVFAGSVPVGAMCRANATCTAPDFPGEHPSNWLPLVLGSNYASVTLGTVQTEFDVTMWGEISSGGRLYRGPSIFYSVQI